ncbi:MAG TPA: M20/M25/M40 family metallo-hydrolase, partial [Bacteroidota bacterium]
EIMELMSYLTDVYGPRLAWSPEYREAAVWASQKLKQWGLHNVHFDNAGPVGKGWTLKRFSANVLTPRAFPLIAYPKAWSPGTKGTVRGNVVVLDAEKEADLKKFAGKLKSAFVLISDPREVSAHFNAEATRLTESDLLEMANAGEPRPRVRGRFGDSASAAMFPERTQLAARKLQFCLDEGAAAVLDAGRGDGGTIFVQQSAVSVIPKTVSEIFGRPGAQSPGAPKIPVQVSVAAEHYNRMIRMIGKGQNLTMEMNLEVEFSRPDSTFNIIAEIPGTELKDEVVMIGAHFDSWQAGTGATDNATGSAVCMEAMRILQKVGLKPRRTIRIGLWAAEEQGLHGSKEYVKEFLGERTSEALETRPAYDNFQVYFNNDNGSGKVRGIYLQGNEAARPIFRSWFEAVKDPTARTITLSNTGGTDHLSFDAIGLPGFQFIQDPIEYSTRTHHSNMDFYDRVQAEDVKQGAIMMAVFAYNAAMMDGKFPRKSMPVSRSQAPSGSQ